MITVVIPVGFPGPAFCEAILQAPKGMQPLGIQRTRGHLGSDHQKRGAAGTGQICTQPRSETMDWCETEIEIAVMGEIRVGGKLLLQPSHAGATYRGGAGGSGAADEAD